jgi:aminoglycoside 3-N-acetyltransferase
MLKGAFDKLGVDGTVIVHVSLSSFGWVCGGAQTVIRALLGCRNVIMASYTGYNTDPSGWVYPSIPESWIDVIRDGMPGYDENLSQSEGVGVVSECFRCLDGVKRSNHPRASFLAYGEDAEFIVSSNGYDFPFGRGTPLGRAYELDAKILLLGVGFNVINSQYLSYYLADMEKEEEICKSKVGDEWVEYLDHPRGLDIKEKFREINEDYFKTVSSIMIGNAKCYLVSQRDLVDFTQKRLEDG